MGAAGFLIEFLAEGAIEFLSDPFGCLDFVMGEQLAPVRAALGYGLLGAALGGLSLWLLPHHLIRPSELFPGVSLLLAPAAVGGGLYLWSLYRRGGAHSIGRLATWCAGSSLAFGLALVRFTVPCVFVVILSVIRAYP